MLPPGVFAMGTFSGTQTSTAANGDKLVMTMSGDVTLFFDQDQTRD